MPVDRVEARRAAAQQSAATAASPAAVDAPAQPPASAPAAQAAPHAAPAPGPEGPAHTPSATPAGEARGAPAGAPAAAGHAAPAPVSDAAHAQPPSHGPPVEGAHGAAGSHQAPAHDESIWPTIARLFNFAVLVAGLVYFLKSPLAQHLASRSQQIRGGLVSARETSARATAQLAELDRRLQTLPAELEALRVRGVEEIAAEERRIQAQAEAERRRLLDDMQRDVDVRLRVARKALTEQAADLAVGLAADRVRQTITEADQARLVDRYASQVKDIHG